MSENEPLIKKPVSIIQEIEAQLENYLKKQREEIEKTLEERIAKERELAREQLVKIEQEVKKEWQALEEYGNLWGEFEEQRAQVLVKIKDYLQRIIDRQQQIESLARETNEDIKAINQLQEQLEEIRSQSMEKAAFLKKRLEEKFGLKTEIQTKAEEEERLDLTPELEKLKKVKELLLLESGISVTPERVPAEEKPKEPAAEEIKPPEVEAQGPSALETFPEEPQKEVLTEEKISLESKLEEEIKRTIAEKLSADQTKSSPDFREEKIEQFTHKDLEEYYRQETANGSGQIGFYQKGKKYILEAEELLNRLRETIDEAKKINYKLAFVTVSKEQFYLKQELISIQEGLKRYLQRILFLMNKKGFRFPALTQDILNENNLKELIEMLSIQNWSSAEELSLFEQKIISLTASFKARTTPSSIYFAALKKELEV